LTRLSEARGAWNGESLDYKSGSDLNQFHHSFVGNLNQSINMKFYLAFAFVLLALTLANAAPAPASEENSEESVAAEDQPSEVHELSSE